MSESLKTDSSKQREELLDFISRIQKGDESALSRLYDITSSFVYGLALKILSNKSDAEEVTLEVFMQVWGNAFSYNSKLSSPLSWLLMITRSRAIDKLRRSSKQRNLEKPLFETVLETTGNPEESALSGEKRESIQNALLKLGDEQRKAIELAYFNGLTQSEIAAEMKQPLGTVKSWIRLGMVKLRQLLIYNEKQ